MYSKILLIGEDVSTLSKINLISLKNLSIDKHFVRSSGNSKLSAKVLQSFKILFSSFS